MRDTSRHCAVHRYAWARGGFELRDVTGAVYDVTACGVDTIGPPDARFLGEPSEALLQSYRAG